MTATYRPGGVRGPAASEHGWTLLAEYGGHARQTLHYFLVVKTAVRVLQAVIDKDVDPDKRDRVRGAYTTCICSRLQLDRDVNKWPWQSIGSLGYREIGARELSAVKEPDERAMEVLRADAAQAILRGADPARPPAQKLDD